MLATIVSHRPDKKFGMFYGQKIKQSHPIFVLSKRKTLDVCKEKARHEELLKTVIISECQIWGFSQNFLCSL
jgi:hypothetical protein